LQEKVIQSQSEEVAMEYIEYISFEYDSGEMVAAMFNVPPLPEKISSLYLK